MPTDKDYLCNGMQEKSGGLQQGEKLDTIVEEKWTMQTNHSSNLLVSQIKSVLDNGCCEEVNNGFWD